MLRKYRIHLASAGLFVILAVIFLIANVIPPSNFPRNVIVKIPQGTTIGGAGEILKEAGIIRSTMIYKVLVLISGNKSGVKTGDYLFENPESVIAVAHRTSNGEQNIQKIKITIPEGSSSMDIAKIIKKSIPEFDSTTFQLDAKQYEGYLFPETYYFFQNVTPEFVINEMRSVFDDKIADIQDKIDVSGKKLEDIVKMASILEKEAASNEDRGIISGILWKRISIGMPLQVDVPFYYSLGKTSSQLTSEDLKKDSPYNTYTRKGLPAGPISNPGLSAINNALYPDSVKYFFFLSDKSGKMYYATTYDGHLQNKNRYMQ